MLTLSVMPMKFAIVRLEPSSTIPEWGTKGNDFFSVTKTKDELSIVCAEENVPPGSPGPLGFKAEKGWQCFKIEGPLDFGMTGVLSSLANPLAQAEISIFTVSTYDTDYLMVKTEKIQKAILELQKLCKIKV